MNMKKKSKLSSKILILAAIFGLASLAMSVAASHSASAQGRSGTTLQDASKTAEGFRERQIEYNWSVAKTADQGSVTVTDGQCATVEYTLQVTRTVFSDVVVTGAKGRICVTNGGSVATQGLRIVDVVQIKTGGGAFMDYATQEVDVSSNPVLDPGETGCYDYEVKFTPVPGAQYKNTAQITITNHSGHLDEPFGPNPSSGSFTIPETPTTVEEDASASVADVLTSNCASGITATPTPAGTSTSFQFSASDLTFSQPSTGSTSRSYNVSVCNNAVGCDNTCTLTNTATLTESGVKSEETRTSSAAVTVSTGECGGGPPQENGDGDEGCSAGFFKNHPNAFPSPYAAQTSLSSVFTCLSNTALGNMTLRQALSFKGGKGVEGAQQILLRQAVAALLNAASQDVDYPLTIQQVITQVCTAIASNDRQIILELSSQLDEFNNLGCPID
jgi:hypothetical protein